MIRLRRITITGFRGARYPLVIDLDGHCRSIAIFGENASGKSSITDAIEWFLTERVDHLWKEDCKEEALRNVHLTDSEDGLVRLEFNDAGLSSEKRLTAKLEAVESNKSGEFKDYKEQAAEERLLLRTSYLGNFIEKTKGEKRKELAGIIGYEALTDFRGVVMAALNSLEKDGAYISAKSLQEMAQGKLAALCGSLLANKAELYAKAKSLVERFNVETVIVDDPSYAEAIEALKGRIAQQEKAARRLKLAQAKKGASELIGASKRTKEAEANFLEPYGRLVANKEKVKLLDLEQFLAKGKHLVERELTEPDKCPFCGKGVDAAHLMGEVESRLDELAAIKSEFESTKGAKARWVDCLGDVTRTAVALETSLVEVLVSQELIGQVKDMGTAAAGLAQLVEDRSGRYEEVTGEQLAAESVEKLTLSLGAKIQQFDGELKALELTKEEHEIIDTIQELTDLRSAFDNYQTSTRTKEGFERQIKTLAKIRDEFIKVQNKAFQHILDVMSEDISRFYLYLHPGKDENVDDVRLGIVGEEGVEFEYSFHGRKTYPPRKYLSESHLNSLGIALFLASVKLFNKKSGFFVLDDVVTSFDAGHRLRLLRLLQEEFKDWQMVLLTHERHWFDMIKKELGAAGWLLRQVDWTPENGVQLGMTPADLRGLIALKCSQGHEVANDVRTLLEAVLKEICHSLEVKVAFRYNDRNEERMAGELLSELRATVNRKAPDIKGHTIFTQIETSNLLGTKGSHDRPKEVSGGDVDVALADITRLEDEFRCGACGNLVGMERFIPGERKIACKCGAKRLAWKE